MKNFQDRLRDISQKTTLTSKTIIDYEKINLNELVKVDSSFNEVIKNNKVSITKLKKQYDERRIAKSDSPFFCF